MVLVAVFMTRASPDGAPRSVTWVFAGVAVVIIVLRAVCATDDGLETTGRRTQTDQGPD